jgi:hypothetical protein
MKKRIKKLLNMFMFSLILLINIAPINNLAFAQNPYDAVLKTTTNSESLKSAID